MRKRTTGPWSSRPAARDKEPASSEAAERFRVIAESVYDGIFAIDEDSTILFANPAAERIFGYSVDELVGQPLTRLIPEPMREAHRAGIRRYLATRERNIAWEAMQLPGLRKDGSEVPLEISFGEYERDGRHLFTGVVRDITERVRQQRLLEEAAAELESTVANLQQRTREAEAARADAEVARAAAEAAEREAAFMAEAGTLLDSSLEYRVTLKSLAHLVVPVLADYCLIDVLEEGQVVRVEGAHTDPDKAALLREIRHRYLHGPPLGVEEVIRSGEPRLVPEIPDVLLEALAHDPDHLELLRKLAPRSAMIVPLAAHGKILGAITFVAADSGRRYGPRDLALAFELARRAALAVDNARLYRDAVVANQIKADFLAVMSHELRTPLNAVIGYADLLLMAVPEPIPEPAVRHVKRIRASGQHLLALIEEILVYARMEAGKERVRPESVKLGGIVRLAAGLIEPLAVEKGLDFQVEVENRGAVLETDAAKVRQILLNLLSNAVKFTDEGRVRLSADVTETEAVFRVEDTGIGIAPEHMETIFEAFWQREPANTRSSGGTGLGLSVARRLARLLAGDVTLTSRVGEGSAFTLRIPLRLPDKP